MKQKKILVIIIIASVIALIAIAIGTFVGIRYADSYERHLELAQKYVVDMEYELAVKEYEKAIAIEPKEKEAYIGLAELYIELGEYENAIDVLETGYDQTGKSSVKKLLEEVMEMVSSQEQEPAYGSSMADTAPAEDENETDSVEQQLYAYLDEQLFPVYHEFDWDGVYKVGYTESGAGFLTNAAGIAHADVRDYDSDGQAELLVLLMRDSAAVWLMYEAADGQVTLADETEAVCGKIGGRDIIEYCFYRRVDGDTVYLAENGSGTVCVLADGVDEFIRILCYTGSGFEEKAAKEVMGSDFSGMETEIEQMADDLRACGFRVSADKLTETLELQKEDGLELVFMVQGVNEKIGEIGMYSAYYDTGDVSVLGEVVIDFYPSEEAYRSSYQILGNTAQKDDFSVSNGDQTIVAFFERIVFEGKDSRRIDWLNAKVEELEEQYREGAVDLDEQLESMAEYASYYNDTTEWYWGPYTLDSVYYDEDGNVSIGYSWEWYMGGVYNYGWENLNYSLADMRELTIYDALGVDWWEGEEIIADALKAEGFDAELLETVRNIGYQGYRFYFDEHTVYLCFNSYDLGRGPGGLQIELPR